MMEGIWLVLEDEFYGKDKILKAFETHKKAFDFINSRLLEEYGEEWEYDRNKYEYQGYKIRYVEMGA